jgi:hypothetical protein
LKLVRDLYTNLTFLEVFIFLFLDNTEVIWPRSNPKPKPSCLVRGFGTSELKKGIVGTKTSVQEEKPKDQHSVSPMGLRFPMISAKRQVVDHPG